VLITVHNFSTHTKLNSSDNLPSYLQTNITAQMLSIRGEGEFRKLSVDGDADAAVETRIRIGLDVSVHTILLFPDADGFFHLTCPAIPFPVHYFGSSRVDDMIVPGNMVRDCRSVQFSDRSFSFCSCVVGIWNGVTLKRGNKCRLDRLKLENSTRQMHILLKLNKKNALSNGYVADDPG